MHCFNAAVINEVLESCFNPKKNLETQLKLSSPLSLSSESPCVGESDRGTRKSISAGDDDEGCSLIPQPKQSKVSIKKAKNHRDQGWRTRWFCSHPDSLRSITLSSSNIGSRKSRRWKRSRKIDKMTLTKGGTDGIKQQRIDIDFDRIFPSTLRCLKKEPWTFYQKYVLPCNANVTEVRTRGDLICELWWFSVAPDFSILQWNLIKSTINNFVRRGIRETTNKIPPTVPPAHRTPTFIFFSFSFWHAHGSHGSPAINWMKMA